MKELLTHSRMDSFKTCRRKHWFAYELGMRREVDAKALRMGSVYHDAIETLGNGGTLETVCQRIYDAYATCPEEFDQQDWEYERETLVRLACAYQWRWSESEIKHITCEEPFELPLINPATGSESKLFRLAGKIDGIVQLEDGRLAVKESKLLGDDISPDSDLWRRMRIDHQISLYILAARRLGYDCDAVLYDVTRKPTIKPTDIALKDEWGLKVVIDEKGNRVRTARGGWRQTASKDNGYVLQTRPMTAEEWGDKLTDDIGERPEYYFARVEIPRLDSDLREVEAEVWDIQRTIRAAQRDGAWYRTVNRNTCIYCSYFGPCTSGYQPSDALPEGFTIESNVHPELEISRYANDTY